jgi:hypothetical protein
MLWYQALALWLGGAYTVYVFHPDAKLRPSLLWAAVATSVVLTFTGVA